MPDQVQNPNIDFTGQGSPPAPSQVAEPSSPMPAVSGLSQDPVVSTPASVEPVPLPKVTDVEKPIEPVAVPAAEALSVKEEVNPLFEKPVTVAPGVKSEQRAANSEQRKLPKGVVAGIAALVFLVVGGLGTGLYLLGQRQEIRGQACYGSWDCGGNSYCAGATSEHTGSCVEGGNRDRTNEEIQQDYQQGGGTTNTGVTDPGAGENASTVGIIGHLGAAPTNPPSEQAAGAAQPTDSPSGSSCNDCGGFNQGQCTGTGFSGCGSECDPGLSKIGGGCYPPSYHDCSGKGVYPPETKCDADDPCAGVTCSNGMYCNGGACVAQKTTTTSDKAIVSFSCSSCSADGRCDSNPQQNSQGYNNKCGQVDECAVTAGQVDYSKCSAIKLCDSSCSGGYAVALGGGGNGGGGGGAPTVTGTPETVSANCQSLVGQVPSGAGGWLTKTDADFVAVARPGDRVRFMCTGAKTGGGFTKSAFYINSVLHIDDVVQVSEDQFAVEYTIGAAGALKVESVLLHDSKGWVD